MNQKKGWRPLPDIITIKESKIDSIILETKNKLKNVYERSGKSLYSYNVSSKK